MEAFVNQLSGFIWSVPLISLFLGAGLLFSVLTRFAQVRLFGEMLRLLFSGKSSEQGISTFQALAVSLSGRVGTGNIAGVAAAIGFGGPGAVFWMWVVAFLGASTAYVESTLGQIYKEEVDGQYRGGPAFYIEKALGLKWYAWLFALTTIVSNGVLFAGVQASSISHAAEVAFGPGQLLNTIVGEVSTTKLAATTGAALVLAFIIFGGVKRIAHVAQVVVPLMAFAYIAIAFVVVGINIGKLPDVIGLILGDALTPMAGVGAAIGWGVKRGVYSNEAGQGSGPHAAAAAEVEHPAQQGLVQAFSVYIDTLLVCTATAFMILITGSYNVHGAGDSFLIQNLSPEVIASSPAFTQYAVDSIWPGVGKPFVALALFFFAFTTLLSYYYMAETNVAYLRRTFKVPGMMFGLKVALVSCVLYGGVRTANLAWGLGDIGLGLMAWMNVVGIIIIHFAAQPAIKALRDYEAQRKAGVVHYQFDPQALGIKNALFWEKRVRKKELGK